jgi:hypothetical protein
MTESLGSVFKTMGVAMLALSCWTVAAAACPGPGPGGCAFQPLPPPPAPSCSPTAWCIQNSANCYSINPAFPNCIAPTGAAFCKCA